MGSFAKFLGAVAGRTPKSGRERLVASSLLESESKNIIVTSRANKVPGSLSLAFDATLKEGHNMRVFGLGTLASMASRERYARFTASMLAVYGAMEEELDQATSQDSPAVHFVWARHGARLRRAGALRADLTDIVDVAPAMTPATRSYVEAVRAAGADDRSGGGARLLGHVYCRYFADLFGGQMLAGPYRAALKLDKGTPRHYIFDLPEAGGRREYIEDVYRGFNEVGERLSPEARDAVVAEALRAFQYNVDVYSEEGIAVDSVKGSLKVAVGYVRSGFAP